MNATTQNVEDPAGTVLKDVSEAGAGVLAESGDGKQLADLPDAERQQVEALMAEIEVGNSQSIIGFGAAAQREVTQVSENMLEGVRNKDTGKAGEALNDMTAGLRGLDTQELKDGKSPGWFKRLFGAVAPITKFIQQYESVKSQIESIVRQLEEHKHALLKDVTMLDRLYNTTLDYFRDLEFYIEAGELKIADIDAHAIPDARAEAEQSDDAIKAQQLRDMQTTREDLERRVHDLKLTRQVVMQSLPSIRMTQELDKSLVNKIQSAVINTVPLWKNQLAQAITVYRTREAASTLKDVSDLNNEMLEANAENLQNANAEVRQEVERGVFAIESIEKANQSLIDTINESIDIAEQGRSKRSEAEGRLTECENQLKQTLRQAAG